MKNYSIIVVLLIFTSCNDCETNNESVSEDYSYKLQKKILDMNSELKLDLEQIYGHFDIAQAHQVVFKSYDNMDSIRNRTFRLKNSSFEFQNKMDKLLLFPLSRTGLDEIENEINVYKLNIIALIDTSHYYSGRTIQVLNEKLGFWNFQELQQLSRNEFVIEKELIKSKFYTAEFLAASQLLMELDVDASVFK